ncbi:MAG TPA: hypothetical protein VK929_16295 [Longimicrobiales bacterium]|nr:hypothetical protein [Longimicrobiales bacterium]
MHSNEADNFDADALRARLEDLDGVDQVVVDAGSRHVCIILHGSAAVPDLETATRELAEGCTVHLTHRAERRERQRVRFASVDRIVQPDQHVMFTVTLEWGGTEYSASATGEKGEALELRTAASAALAAVTALVPDDLDVRLAGIKHVRAFDADMVVVSLFRREGQPRNLVGAVVAGSDSPRAAVTAVLNALNRLLGNFLSLP